MKYFCMLVDLGLQTQRRIRFETIHDAMTTIMYPLLPINDLLPSSVDENIRIGLLAFSYHVFVQWQDVKPFSYDFLSTYKSHLCSNSIRDNLPSKILLWLSMVGAISLYEIKDEPWLQQLLTDQLRNLGLHSWADMRETLKSVMWISLLDEKPGRDVYEVIKIN